MRQFRPITTDDFTEVVSLLEEAFLVPAQRFGVSSASCPVYPAFFHVDRLKSEIAAKRRFFVVEEDDLVVGCIAMAEDHDGQVELSRLAVSPSRLGQGIGTMLLEKALAQADDYHAAKVKVHLYARAKELIQWYRERGFELVDAFEVNDVPTPIAKMAKSLSGGKPAFIRKLTVGDEAELERFLLKHRESSAMLLSNLRKGGIVNHGRARQAEYIAAIRGNRIIGVAALCWNNILLPQAPEMLDELVRTAMAINDRGLEGVIGLEQQVTRTANVLGLPGGKAPLVMMDSHEILYALEIAKMRIPGELKSGLFTVRRVEPRDYPVLTDWMVDYNLETLHRHLSRDEVEANFLRACEERDNRWVLESAEGLRATTGFSAAAREVVQVGGVYTPPALRGRHYARTAVAGSLLEAQSDGVPLCVLFTAEENVPAQRAYEALGFREHDHYRLLLFTEPVRTRLIMSGT